MFFYMLTIMLLEWEIKVQVTDGWTDAWICFVIHFRCVHPSAWRCSTLVLSYVILLSILACCSSFSIFDFVSSFVCKYSNFDHQIALTMRNSPKRTKQIESTSQMDVCSNINYFFEISVFKLIVTCAPVIFRQNIKFYLSSNFVTYYVFFWP